MDDPYQLTRFVEAQNDGQMYDSVVEELGRGRKVHHWMWFIFPQVAGLGSSSYARKFAITGLDEARAYLRHPVLGPRIRECTRLLLATEGKAATEILGHIDAMKLRSSMTLFSAADPAEPAYREVLTKYFDGRPDQETLNRLPAGR